jgi:hypothetical protein
MSAVIKNQVIVKGDGNHINKILLKKKYYQKQMHENVTKAVQ